MPLRRIQLNEIKRKRTLTFDYYYVNLLLSLFRDRIKVCVRKEEEVNRFETEN